MVVMLFLNLFASFFSFLAPIGRIIMSVFVNWWRNRWLKHIEQTITHEDTRIIANFGGRIPHLTLSWNIHNRSMANVAVSQIVGDLYAGFWRIGTFEMYEPVEKQHGYSWQPIVTITQKNLKKDAILGVEITLFPTTEFWLTDIYSCSLFNTKIKITSFWGSVMTKNDKENILIENGQSIASQYRSVLSTRLKSLV
jgi:hypothetical protein